MSASYLHKVHTLSRYYHVDNKVLRRETQHRFFF